jgi:hypothetical protein
MPASIRFRAKRPDKVWLHCGEDAMKKSIIHSLLVVAALGVALVACERRDGSTPTPPPSRPMTSVPYSLKPITAQWVLHARPVPPPPGWT